MGPDDVAVWLAIFKEIGPVWGVLFLIAGTMFFQAKRGSDTPSESAEPITRKDLDTIEQRMARLEEQNANVLKHMAIDIAFIQGHLGLDSNRKG